MTVSYHEIARYDYSGDSNQRKVLVSYQDCRTALTELIGDERVRVVALSGPWGTGKTHLWKDVQKEFSKNSGKQPVSVSLFGVASVRELGLRIAQSVLTGQDTQELRERVAASWRWMKDALKSVHAGFEVLDELTHLAVPKLLEGRLLVLDDIERKHSDLHVDELLGFVDNCARALDCRIVLILNADRLADEDAWQQFREKVIDEEIALSITPSEAFMTAVKASEEKDAESAARRSRKSGAEPLVLPQTLALPATDLPTLRQAIEHCGIINIRVIHKLTRLTETLLGQLMTKDQKLRTRIVGSAVLLGAIDLRALPLGPSTAYVLAHGRTIAGDTPEVPHSNVPMWNSLLDALEIHAASELEEGIASYISSRTRNMGPLRKALDHYAENMRRLNTLEDSARLIRDYQWCVDEPDSAFLSRLQSLKPHVHHLDAESIDGLVNQFRAQPIFSNVVSEIATSWINHFKKEWSSSMDGPAPRPFVMRWPKGPLNDPEINEAVGEYQRWSQFNHSFRELCRTAVQGGPFESRDHYLLNNLSTEQVHRELQAAQGQDLELMVTAGIMFCQESRFLLSEKYGWVARQFDQASAGIISSEPSSRRGRLLQQQRVEAGLAKVESEAA